VRHSLAGFSGTSLLNRNYTLYHYLLPLAALSMAFLRRSLLFAARDLTQVRDRSSRRASVIGKDDHRA
jgi:hypothetical protein